jgi:hypothetical protein
VKRLILITVLLATVVFAIDEPLKIRTFLGVDKQANPLTMPPGSAEVCLNWDLGKTFGVATLRDGFGLFHYPAGSGYAVLSDLTGIYAYGDRLGHERYFVTGDIASTGKPWGYLAWHGDSINPIWLWSFINKSDSQTYLYRGETPSWAVMNDILVMANGQNFPLRFNGTNWKPLCETPPGDFRYAPVKSSNAKYRLNGTYFYTTKLLASPIRGYMYEPKIAVRVDSGHVLLSAPENHFSSSADSFKIVLYRCRANKTPADSFFVLDTIYIVNDSAGQYWIDSIPDCSLGAATRPYIYGGIPDTSVYGYTGDTIGDTMARIGRPKWKSTIYDSLSPGTTPFHGISKDQEGDTNAQGDMSWKYTHYTFAYIDTSTMMVSDVGPYCRIPTVRNDSTSLIYDTAIVLLFAAVPPEKDYCWRLLCRRMEKVSREKVPDSAYDYYYASPSSGGGDGPGSPGGGSVNYSCPRIDGVRGMLVIRNGKKMCRYEKWVKADTIAQYTTFEPWHVVDTIKNGNDTTYTDSKTWSKIMSNGDFSPGYGYFQMNYPTVYGNRLWMADGEYVRYCNYSFSPEIGNWPPGNAVAVNPDDNDEITGLLNSGGRLLAFKNASIFSLTEPEYNAVRVEEMISGTGNIAPGSIIKLPDGGYGFLSKLGFQEFSSYLTSPYKTSGGNQFSISSPIQKNLDKYTMATLRGCHAWLTPDEKNLALSFPGVDTTWFYALNGAGWWNAKFSFRQTTRYDTASQADRRPMSKLLAVLNASDSVFQFGHVKTDTGKTLTATWKSNPLFVNAYMNQLHYYGVWRQSNDTNAALVEKVYFQGRDTSGSVSYSDSATWKYWKYEIYPEPGLYYQFEVQYTGDSMALQGIDIWNEFGEDIPGE